MRQSKNKQELQILSSSLCKGQKSDLVGMIDEKKSGIYHRPNVDINDLTMMLAGRVRDDCAFCFHPKLRHEQNIGICNQCGFWCKKYRNYRPIRGHIPNPNFRYWYEDFT